MAPCCPTPFLDVERARLERQRTGPARPRVRSAVRRERALLRKLHQQCGRQRPRVLPGVRQRRRGRCRRAASFASRWASRTTITMAATSPSVPTAISTWASAMVAAVAIPTATARTATTCWARSCASTSARATGYAVPASNPLVGVAGHQERTVELGPPQSVALQLRPVHRRSVHRRRRPGRARGDRRRDRGVGRRQGRELRLEHHGGNAVLRREQLRHDRPHAAGTRLHAQ